MRVLFIVPWVKSLFGDGYQTPGHPHIGVAYLSAILKKNGHRVKIFDQAIEKDDQKIFKLCRNFKPGVIGITTFSYCYQYVLDLIAQLKKQTTIPIILGGAHVSAVRDEVLKKTAADFAIFGEAETSFLNFLEESQKTKPNFATVANLIWRDRRGQIIENKKATLIQNLDDLPFPDYSEFKLEKYAYYTAKTMPIITSRGCPYQCNYCSVRLSMGRGFRGRSPENVIAEIKYWQKKGFKNFEINDDCFSFNLARAEKICDLIIQNKLEITYQLYNGIRVDRISPRLLAKMKASGCVFISYGAESGDQKIIEKIGKGITLKQVEKAVRWTNAAKIKNSVNFIIGHPGESYETALATIAFASGLPANFVNFFNLIPYPGTALYTWIKKNARWVYQPEYILKNIGSRDLKPAFETKEFSATERIKALKMGFALYEKTILRFRFGKFAGDIVFALSRNQALFKAGIKAALNSKIGFWLYKLITFHSRKK